MSRKILQKLFLLTMFFSPLYVIRLRFLNIPINLLDIFLFLSIVLAAMYGKKKILKIFAANRTLYFCAALVFGGTLIAILFNYNYATGFGILKSWFLLPFMFSLALLSCFERTEIEKLYYAIFASSSTVGAIALFYKIFNVVTFDDRLTAFYLSPNHLAMYLVPGFIFGLYFLLKSPITNNHVGEKFLQTIMLLLILLPLYFTYSYGSWTALALSILITMPLVLLKKSWQIYFIVIFVFFSLFLTQVNNRKFQAIKDLQERSSLSSRLTIWQVSWKLISEHPLIGIGAGNFQSAYLSEQKNFPPYLEWAVPQPHNIFLAFWLQSGLLGLTGFIGILIFIFKNCFVLIRNKKNALLIAPLFAFFLYTSLHGLIDTTYWKNDLSLLFWVSLALLVVLLKPLDIRDV